MTIKAFREALKRSRVPAASGRVRRARQLLNAAQIATVGVYHQPRHYIPVKAWFNQPRDKKGRFAKRAA